MKLLRIPCSPEGALFPQPQKALWETCLCLWRFQSSLPPPTSKSVKSCPPKSCWKDPLCVFFIPYALRNNRTFCSTSQNTLTKAPSCHYMPRSVQISMGKIPAIVIAIAVPAWSGKAAGYSLPQNRISVCLSSQVTPRIRKCPSLKFKRKKKRAGDRYLTFHPWNFGSSNPCAPITLWYFHTQKKIYFLWLFFSPMDTLACCILLYHSWGWKSYQHLFNSVLTNFAHIL